MWRCWSEFQKLPGHLRYLGFIGLPWSKDFCLSANHMYIFSHSSLQVRFFLNLSSWNFALMLSFFFFTLSSITLDSLFCHLCLSELYYRLKKSLSLIFPIFPLVLSYLLLMYRSNFYFQVFYLFHLFKFHLLQIYLIIYNLLFLALIFKY